MDNLIRPQEEAVSKGPVAAAVDASTWQFYSGGIYSGPCSSVMLDHGNLFMGISSNASKTF